MSEPRDLPAPPFYVDRTTGAKHLCVSVDTWDNMVRSGELPQPTTTVRGRPRWRWTDIVAHLEGAGQSEGATGAADDAEGPDPISERTRAYAKTEKARGRAA